MQRKYDRKVPLPLPLHAMLQRRTASLPSVVDLRSNCGPLKDQGSEGACTGHGGSECGEWIYRAYRKEQPIFSPGYLYEKELQAQGSFPNDVGSDGVTLCQQAIANGFCPLSDSPYTPGVITAPTTEQDAAAAKYKLIAAYHGLVGSETALSVLGDPVPWPVLVGFTVYSSFESDETAQTGIYNPVPTEESILGGHEVLMVGFDVGLSPTLRPAGCPPAALIQNSWGVGWGLSGFFWMALSVLDASDTDLKILHLGKPWA